MDLSEALDRIDAIHSHLARGEQYRGYRPFALALSGGVGLIAAFAQPWFVEDGDRFGFVRFWIGVALASAAVAASAAVYSYLLREDGLARRKTRTVVRQFIPCLLAGVVVTAAVLRLDASEIAIPLLPPLWALLFALGIVASLPYLPRPTALVAVWYFLAALVLFSSESIPGGWAVGVPFGVGQLLAACVMAFGKRREVTP